MALRPDIIMAGRQPNMVNVLANSAQAAGMQNEVVKQNRLAQLYNEQGPAIMSGDRNALNAYAKISPEAALGVQGTRLGMDVQKAQLEQLRFQTKTAMENLIRTRGQEEAAQIAAQEQRAVKVALAAPSQEALDAFLTQNGMEDFVGVITIENRDMYASQYIEGMSDAFETFTPGGGKQSEADAEIARLVGIGIPYDTAVRIKEGVLKTDTDPITRELQVIDISTGEKVWPKADTPAPEPAPAETPANNELGPQFSDAEGAFGLEGQAKRALNSTLDYFGFDPAFPEAQQTAADFAVLGEDLFSEAAAAWDRQPPKFVLENIQALIPKAGSALGKEGAQTKLRALARSFSEKRDAIQQQLADRRLSPNDRAALEAQLTATEVGLAKVGKALSSFRREESANTTSSGVKWKIVE